MGDVTTEPRTLPAEATTCAGCGRPIVFAVTVAGENGRGGKHMPLDPIEDAAGNTAVRPAHGRLLARVLKKDETHDHRTEYLAMPHFATCTRRPDEPQLPDNVVSLQAHRTRRRRRGRR